MKFFILILFLAVLFNISFAQNREADVYIQLASVYFHGRNSVTIGQNEREKIWDNGRYLKFINPNCRVILKIFSDSTEIKKLDDKLLVDRGEAVANVLINDCELSKDRITFWYIGSTFSVFNNKEANRRVDIDIEK